MMAKIIIMVKNVDKVKLNVGGDEKHEMNKCNRICEKGSYTRIRFCNFDES